jgi:hypothetical protein
MSRAGRPVLLNSKLRCEPAHESDARIGAWPRAKLEAMDRRFVERLERAIARGEEHVTVTPCSRSTMPRLPA